MSAILTPVLLVVAVGFVLAIILTIASKVFYVPVDETVANLRAELPGANCGACGYTGCDGYAEAVAKLENVEEEARKKVEEMIREDKETLEKIDLKCTASENEEKATSPETPAVKCL